MPSKRQVRLDECFGHRRQCLDRYLAARRALDTALARHGNPRGDGKASSAGAFEQIVRLKRQCESADEACVDALTSYAEEVLARARFGRFDLFL